MTELKRVATRVAMYRAARTDALPPQTERLPRKAPLSRLMGATPTSAAICLRSRAPNSGSSAKSVTVRLGPTPGTLRNRSSCARHNGLLCTMRSRSPSKSWRVRSNQAICRLRLVRTLGMALPRRCLSATSISSSCRRRATKAAISCTWFSARGRGVGWSLGKECQHLCV